MWIINSCQIIPRNPESTHKAKRKHERSLASGEKPEYDTYWAITSSKEHLEEVKSVTFHAFLSHVLNKHKDLPNRLFNACAHGNITTPRVWITKGMTDTLFL